MTYSKEKQLAYRKNRKNKNERAIPESLLQKQADDLLRYSHIDYIRFNDNCWYWLKQNAPAYVIKYFSDSFAGLPDNTCFIPISDKYSIALHLELKTSTGRLHGKQKSLAKRLPFQISRSPEETIEIVNNFIHAAGLLKEMLKDDW